jgi:Xaa-Pro aminopeptidase
MGALRRKLTRAGLSGLLVTHLPDLRYLCGFTGSSAALAVTRRSARLFTDGRHPAQGATTGDTRLTMESAQPGSGAEVALASYDFQNWTPDEFHVAGAHKRAAGSEFAMQA